MKINVSKNVLQILINQWVDVNLAIFIARLAKIIQIQNAQPVMKIISSSKIVLVYLTVLIIIIRMETLAKNVAKIVEFV